MAGGSPSYDNPEKVNGGRAQNKTKGVEGRLGRAGHFNTMGVTVKEGKEGNPRHGEADGESFVCSNGQTQREDRDGDTDFHREKGQAEHSQKTAHQHERDKGQGHSPNGTASHLGAENPNTEHGQEVVGSEYGMSKAVGKTKGIVSGMGEQRGREKAEK
jgi:hypothetical protein